jgi:hypothetical protein
MTASVWALGMNVCSNVSSLKPSSPGTSSAATRAGPRAASINKPRSSAAAQPAPNITSSRVLPYRCGANEAIPQDRQARAPRTLGAGYGSLHTRVLGLEIGAQVVRGDVPYQRREPVIERTLAGRVDGGRHAAVLTRRQHVVCLPGKVDLQLRSRGGARTGGDASAAGVMANARRATVRLIAAATEPPATANSIGARHMSPGMSDIRLRPSGRRGQLLTASHPLT